MQKIFFFIIILSAKISFAQYPVLEDTLIMNQVKTGLAKMYNRDSDAADSIFNKLKKEIPNHPAVPFLMGLNVYWKYYPIIPNVTPGNDLFVAYMDNSIELSEVMLDKNDKNIEACFFNLVAHGLLMLNYSDNGMSSKVFSHANPAYKQILKSFDMVKESEEFYFIVGLYNYYVKAYPEAHPVYKPIVYFFKEGNKEEGLKELKYAANNSVFLKTEALQYLSLIYLSFEKNVTQALVYSKKLYDLYPNNPYFFSCYVENLLLEKKYNEAQPLIKEMYNDHEDKYNLMWALLYTAIVEERYKNQPVKAEKDYNIVLELTEVYGFYANQAAAYAHIGLSRIYKETDPKKSKYHLKDAKKLAYYDYALW